MRIFSFVMSVVMIMMSAFVPVKVAETGYENAGVSAASAESQKATFFSEQAKEIFSVIINNIVNEAKKGDSDSQEIIDLLNNLPVYEESDERPHHAEIKINPVTKEINKVLNKIVQSTMSDGMIKSFFNEITKGMYDLYIYLVPVDGEENVYYLNCDHVDDNGVATEVFTGIKYNKETGKMHGKDNNGLMGIGFDYDVKNYTITTPVNVWMRDMGYSVFYDILGGLGFMDTDTVRVKFEHGGKYWMFQFWKGNYGFRHLNGAELGIYNKTDEHAVSYNCATNEEMLVMSTTLRTEKEVLIEREAMLHWWMCGFRFGPSIDKNDLIMENTIQFEDEEMMNSFLEATKEYSDEMTVSAENLKVSIIWQ